MKLYEGLNPDFQYSEQLTAMVATSQDGGLEAVELNADKEPDSDILANSDKTTAFIHASPSGHIVIVKVLLRKNTPFSERRTVRFTDLMVASMNGYAEIVKLLLDKGANPGLKDTEGKTAWDYAGNPDIRSLIEKAGFTGHN
jgi:ankyrin repeat protein